MFRGPEWEAAKHFVGVPDLVLAEIDPARLPWEQTVPWPVSIRLRAHTPFPPSYTTAIDPDGRLHITFTIYKWV